MLTQEWARQFAEAWIEAWNSHDMERIFAHYTDDFEMTSQLIIQWMGVESGTLKGKDAIRPYWQRGLDATPPLHFELVDALVGVNSVVIFFRRASGKQSAEVLIFNEQGLVVKGMGHHG
jgi:ketosteroid isomerase-like protein